jgi:hypothetical protein
MKYLNSKGECKLKFEAQMSSEFMQWRIQIDKVDTWRDFIVWYFNNRMKADCVCY